MSYALDTKAAREGDSHSSRITETGAYVGTFTRAEKVISKQDTTGIELTFESKDKATADFLTMWTINKAGEQIYGYKQLMALMTCLKAKGIEEKQGQVEKFENGQRQKVNATIYPDLMSKQIGVVLQKEEYQKNNGQIGTKFNLYGFFDPTTRMTAIEILDRASSATKLDQMLAGLKDKPMQAQRNAAPPQAATANVPDEDDIPW